MSSEPAGDGKDGFTREFIQKLDLGEFDGKIHQVLQELTKEELVRLAEYLATRAAH